MSADRISRYAAGIYEIAEAEGESARVSDELGHIAESFEASTELSSALSDPRLPLERKQAVITDLLGGRASDLTVQFVDFLVSAGRVSDLGDIARSLFEQASRRAGMAMAEVRSAVELDDATVGRLEQALSQATGRTVEARVVVDPAVLGGLVARIGDTVIDGSLRAHLESLRETLEAS